RRRPDPLDRPDQRHHLTPRRGGGEDGAVPGDRGLLAIVSVAPVVRNGALRRAGPELARTLNAVSRLLTTSEVRRMNVAVVERHARPAAVARAFLRAHGLI